MTEISLMDPSKETDNKLRWQAWESGVLFKLYIPKWRVPAPWPVRILVRVDDDDRAFRDLPPPRGPKSARSRNLDEPLVALLTKVRVHTETVRYKPVGDPELWEIGEPYIPLLMLSTPPPDRVRVDVRWDRSAGTSVRVAMASGSVRVRLIGIDAPETSPGDRAGRQGTQLGKDTAIIVALGKQAKAAAERLAPFGTAVRVETEVALYDRYARLLAYLWLPDGRMVNEELVRDGWALVLTIPPNVRYADRFVRAQQDARAHRRGLWASP